MKKFLHLELEKSAPEIPLALDQRILAAAAMRANSFRRRKLIFRIALPASVASAAAAAVVLCSGVIHLPQQPVKPAAVTPVSSIATQTSTPRQKITTPENNMLALYDMTALEQDNYTIALVSETSWDEDLLSI